jgi:hypothetical protein
VQYDSSNKFSGNSNQYFWDKTNNRLGIGTSAPTSQFNIWKNSINDTMQRTYGLTLTNTREATSTQIQFSPAYRLKTNGWKTSATAASQDIIVENYIKPYNGTTSPNFWVEWAGAVNGSTTYWPLMRLYSAGGIQIQAMNGTGGGISLGAAAPSPGVISGTTSLNFYTTSANAGTAFYFYPNLGFTQTSGTVEAMELVSGIGFAPTSGTAIYSHLNLIPTINQTGGANGKTYGLKIEPTLTAAYDFAALKTTAGKTELIDQTFDQSSTVQTTNATPTTIATIPLSISGDEMEVDVSIHCTFSTNNAFYTRLVRVKNIGGVVSLQGTFQTIGTDFEDAALSTANVTATVSGTDLIIQGAGIAATNINWQTRFRIRRFN